MAKERQRKCPECKGTMSRRPITHDARDAEGTFYIVENVPAWVCTACGSLFLDAEVEADLERLVGEGKPTRTVQTPVYDFDRLEE